MLQVGEIVRGNQWPETVEIKRCIAIDEHFYIIEALGRTTRTYYETMLEGYQIGLLERLSVQEGPKGLIAHTVQRYLQYYVLAAQKSFSRCRALGSQTVMPLPHQIEAVYDRMLQVPQVRFLLADDPGAGKTIMSGMLIRELQARGVAERILILVPPLVLLQWQEELREKFGMEFQVINRNTLKDANGRNPFELYPHCLASLFWTAREDIRPYVQDASFELIIVDEAHKMAAYTHGKKVRKTKRTRLYQLGESILRHTAHRLLLTATPHKGDRENFRHLLQLIDPDIFAYTGSGEELREQSNPFIIRRLKEKMVQFDGTPLFPPRTTKTIEFDLSPLELELYEEVTEYVRNNFNRAERTGNTGTAFTMMLLQRRLSSSIEAIHLSLERRQQRIQELLNASQEEREHIQHELSGLELEQYEDETAEEQQEMEASLEGAVVSVAEEELYLELQALDHLLHKTARLRSLDVERKYLELEKTLFGPQGLLNKGEKIVIFTESADTLRYLESRLQDRVPGIAKIIGSYSMEERRRQVELFRKDFPIMLATDAGGESINLQFCNQMINYDIPWNPNKLEQRMGRIHRIGQKNEVFVFNLVAKNTREGDVLFHLLRKLEQMRKDLGHDLIYDFIGEILEDQGASLADLMQDCVLNRRHLDEIIAGIERVLSEEHRRLLERASTDRLDEESIDLPGMRREQKRLLLRQISSRTYADFIRNALASRKVTVSETKDQLRIDRFPKALRDFARKNGITADLANQQYRITGHAAPENPEVEPVHVDHPLLQLAMAITRQDLQKIALEHIELAYPTREKLLVELLEVSVMDGTGRELNRELLHLAKRPSGEFLLLDPYWLMGVKFTVDPVLQPAQTEQAFFSPAVREAMVIMAGVKAKRDEQLNLKSRFLRRTFETQYLDTMNRLNEYRAKNTDNRYSALINQMSAQLVEIEERREDRLAEIERERSIQMRPPKRILQVLLKPDGSVRGVGQTETDSYQVYRQFPRDWLEVVQRYELMAGRTNVQALPAFGLVDFISEAADGESRFIILTDEHGFTLTKEHQQDLGKMLENTWIYLLIDEEIIRERRPRP
ncbi:MAG: DEAD/DEAH box helicase [Firmicutes bacterium]|nr:DEAD/DEAH box helicase [Bacillota bacterium]MDA8226842.1 helicase-related protein [Desulfitobacterium hafniense]